MQTTRPLKPLKYGSNLSFFAKALLHVRVQIIKLWDLKLFGSPRHLTVINADVGETNDVQ
jgi:hypothetical protein